jgi:hypothetical protein
MVVLLRQRDGLLVGAHLHRQTRAAGGDGHRLVAQLAHEVKRLPRGLLPGQPQRVGRHLLFDRRPHRGGGAEEPVRRHQAAQGLVRALEVIVLEEEAHPALAVREIREDRAREKLLPQGLPKALDLAQGLGMVRPALDVPDAVPAELLLKARLPAPGRVLPPLVGQDLARGPVVGDPARQGLEDQGRPLMVREDTGHDVARVIIEERRHPDALVPAQAKGKEVRLPELVGLRPLEAPLRRAGLGPRA